HGGNKGLVNLDLSYMEENFRFSILDIFKSTVDDNVIIQRESWWKETLQIRKFGYNLN
ncbi:GIY-YIG nuclease family protein, partial [Acinetobacter baumannii]